jgi:dynein heavy chain
MLTSSMDCKRVEQEARDCLDRLSLAERLTNGLASEKDRWSLAVEGFKACEVTMAGSCLSLRRVTWWLTWCLDPATGDVMLAAAFASYLGAFGAVFRNSLWRETWLQDLVGRDIPLTPNVDPLWVLTSDSQTAVWQNEGK